jgi:hypothetical protein
MKSNSITLTGNGIKRLLALVPVITHTPDPARKAALIAHTNQILARIAQENATQEVKPEVPSKSPKKK